MKRINMWVVIYPTTEDGTILVNLIGTLVASEKVRFGFGIGEHSTDAPENVLFGCSLIVGENLIMPTNVGKDQGTHVLFMVMSASAPDIAAMVLLLKPAEEAGDVSKTFTLLEEGDHPRNHDYPRQVQGALALYWHVVVALRDGKPVVEAGPL